MLRLVSLLVLGLMPGLALAQAPAAAPPSGQSPAQAAEQPPLLLIFDASGSMNQRMGNETRLQAAKRVVDVALGCLAPGHGAVPRAHVFWDDRVGWLEIADSLPHLGGKSGVEKVQRSKRHGSSGAGLTGASRRHLGAHESASCTTAT